MLSSSVQQASGDLWGEIIQASISCFTAQCHRLEDAPALGSMVTTSDPQVKIYAIVHNSTTGSIDPGRRSMALGQGETGEEGVYRSHPELSQLLRTDFDAIVVGNWDASARLRYALPPRPSRLHAFVHAASADDMRQFTQSLEFLHHLLNFPSPTRDDALVAFLRLAAIAHDDGGSFLLQAGKALAVLLGRDAPRLNIMLRQLE